MSATDSSSRQALEVGESFLGHVAAVVIGVILVVVGLALGVTMIMLPVGFVLGIAGILLIVWGVFERRQKA